MADPDKLKPGHCYLRGRGVASYAGVLREGEGVRWRCGHDHASARHADRCAGAELERRRQAARAVLELLHCGSCDIYFGPDGEVLRAREEQEGGECSLCRRPLDPVRVIVL